MQVFSHTRTLQKRALAGLIADISHSIILRRDCIYSSYEKLELNCLKAAYDCALATWKKNYNTNENPILFKLEWDETLLKTSSRNRNKIGKKFYNYDSLLRNDFNRAYAHFKSALVPANIENTRQLMTANV